MAFEGKLVGDDDAAVGGSVGGGRGEGKQVVVGEGPGEAREGAWGDAPGRGLPRRVVEVEQV